MAYRPHFAYHQKQGLSYERAEFPFDLRQAPGTDAAGNVPDAGEYNMVLRLDQDADFLWREIFWIFPDDFLAGQVAARIRGPFGNHLSSDFVPLLNWGSGYYTLQPWTAAPPTGPSYVSCLTGGMGVPLVDEIFCPASSVLQLDLLPLTVNSFADSPVGRFLARGVKRRPQGDCAVEYRA